VPCRQSCRAARTSGRNIREGGAEVNREHNSETKRRVRAVLFALLLWIIGTACPGARANPAGARPDVLILVYALSDGQGQVGVTYPGVVPRAQAQRDLQAIATQTGWRISKVKITDLPPPIQNARGKMTGIEFTASGAILPQSNTVTLEPFISALRDYHQIGLTYFTEPGFGFQGLRAYADNHVQIAMTQRGTTYSYSITVRDPHFGRLNLPRYQLAPGDSRSVSAPETARRLSRPWLVALVVLAALGAGTVVYAVLARQA